MYNIHILNNGLKLATCNLPNTRSVTLGLWVGVGGRYETKGMNGITHFVEHMVFKGTKNRSYRQIKESIEGVGGMLNGFTSEELTCYLAKVLKSHVPSSLDVLIDMLFNPTFKEKDIAKERMVIYEEIKMYFDLPHYLAYDNLLKMLWPDQPLGRNLAGNFRSLRAIKRPQLIAHLKKYYNLGNMLICAAGDITMDELSRTVKKICRSYKIENPEKKRTHEFLPATTGQKKVATNFIDKGTQQTHICLGINGINRTHELRYALVLLHIIMGANMSSRLFNEVREKKGYAYEIGTALKSFQDTGAFMVNAGIVNEKIEHGLALILSELKKICRHLVTPQELMRAKEYFCGQLEMSLEDTLEHMLWMGDKIMTKRKLEKIQVTIDTVRKVSAEDIKSVANLIFSDNHFQLSLVGPISQKKSRTLQEILGGFRS